MAIRPLEASSSSSYGLDMPCKVPPWKDTSLLITNCFTQIASLKGLEKTSRSFTVLDEMAALQNSVEKATALAARIRCSQVQSSIQESPPTKSLEARFQLLCLQPVDIHAQLAFRDHMSPNEWSVLGIQPHLDQVYKLGCAPVYHISTGTERSVFGFLLANNCKGLIIRDINPRVKAYSDFNILMLRTLKDVDEYLQLSSSDPDPQIMQQKKVKIWERLEADREMSPEVKAYYQQHFTDLATVYFREIAWREEQPWDLKTKFQGVDYYHNGSQFQKLKSFAKSGNIIATIGDISDLTEFADLPIGVVDISNIPNYVLLNFKWPRDVQIIWTKFQTYHTRYFSKKLSPISVEERVLCSDLLDSLQDSEDIEKMDGVQYHELPEWLELQSPPFFCKELLVALKTYRDEKCLYSPKLGWISPRTVSGYKLRKASVQDFRDLNRHPEIQKISADFAGYWVLYRVMPKYLAMMDAPGWMNGFLAVVKQNANNSCFIEWLTANAGYLQAKMPDFPSAITSENLEKWVQNNVEKSAVDC